MIKLDNKNFITTDAAPRLAGELNTQGTYSMQDVYDEL